MGRFYCHCMICQAVYKQPYADVTRWRFRRRAGRHRERGWFGRTYRRRFGLFGKSSANEHCLAALLLMALCKRKSRR